VSAERPLRVVVLDDYQDVARRYADWERLPAGTDLDVVTVPLRGDLLVERLHNAQVIVAMRERTPFPASLLERLPALQLLVSTGGRNRAIDVAACARLGVTVTGTASDVSALAGTVELTWSLILALCKRTVPSDRATRHGVWQPHVAQNLKGKTLAVAGLGRIGGEVARIGAAFGMEVLAWSPHLTPARATALGACAVGRRELFERADVLSLHLVPGTGTVGIVDAPHLALMRSHAMLVNTARAALLDEPAVLAALRERRIGGAGFDVYGVEPLPPDHPLLELDNVVLSPHLGYVTEENVRVYYGSAVDRICRWASGAAVPLLA